MLKNALFSLLVTITFSVPAPAQSMLGFQYPLGNPVRSGCGTALSLAGTGTGIGNDLFGLTQNPANLGISHRTTFSLTVSGDLLSLRENDLVSRHLDMSLRMLSLTVPVGALGAIGVSVEPYSTANVRFRLVEPITIDRILADTTVLGILEHGGALSWQAGWGYTIKKRVRIGIAYRYLNYNRSLAEVKQIQGSLNDRLVDSTRSVFATSGLRAGLQVPLGKLTLGISGDYFFLNQARTTRTISGTRDSAVITRKNNYDFKPPPAFTLGVSYQFDIRWLAALDGGATLWDRYFSAVAAATPINNAYFVSGGVQFIPAPNLLTPKLYEVTQYRAGIRYAQLPAVEAVEVAGTLALGLPLLASGGMFDIIVEFGRRWDERFENYRENTFSLKLGINGARKWYQSSDDSY
jgi:hypothetical protein